MRTFDSGATRSADTGKPDYEGFLSPLVIVRYGEYMQKHRVQADGNVRDSDNWQHGIPKDAYIKSLFRHFIDLWQTHRGHATRDKDTGEVVGMEDSACAILFNVSGFLHELLKNPY